MVAFENHKFYKRENSMRKTKQAAREENVENHKSFLTDGPKIMNWQFFTWDPSLEGRKGHDGKQNSYRPYPETRLQEQELIRTII